MRRETLVDFFAGFAGVGEDFLVYDDGYRTRTYTYAQVFEAAHAFAEKLADSGITKGHKVLLWGENRPEWIVALWACIIRGVVAVPLDYRASANLVSRVQAVAGAALLLTGDEVPDPPELGIPVWKLSGIQWERPREAAAASELTRDDLAEVLFTSGATAEPKGVLITHRNILANVVPVEDEVRKYLVKYRTATRLFFPIRFLNLLPLSHMFGQAMATFIPPMLPGIVVFMHGFGPNDIVRQIKARRISVLVCVPKILEVLRDYVVAAVPEAAVSPPAGEHVVRRWWRYRQVHRLFGFKFWAFVVGAAALDPELEQFWKQLGFVVIQGYGLTETAPIVTLNHPFHTKAGSVGKPIAGVQVKISPEGEILVRGDNVTTGYLNGSGGGAFEDGWFRTGDVGTLDETGQLHIRGRLKEMIVTAEGLNVFPEDVEHVLDRQPGVKESAVVGTSRVHAVLVLEDGADAGEVVRKANAQLEDHQKIRDVSIWPGESLPRTEGTRKLKRGEIRSWVSGAGAARPATHEPGAVEAVLARFAPNRQITAETTLDELGLTSLERVELLMSLEQRLGTSINESEFTARCSVADLQRMSRNGSAPSTEPVELPLWNRSRFARVVRRVNLPTWVLPLARVFSWVRAEGLENLRGLEPPVIFAANHQSHLDVPSIFAALPAKWRYRATPAMSKEFFHAHFYPKSHSSLEWFTNSLNYYLASLVFNAFPLPQRESGARQTIRYAGELAAEGWCVLIFPEGKITESGDLNPFQPGVAMMASKLGVPVVPIRIRGLYDVLRKGWSFPRPGRVYVKFGSPLRLQGEDYQALVREVEDAVRQL